jgi:hypothetical protein
VQDGVFIGIGKNFDFTSAPRPCLLCRLEKVSQNRRPAHIGGTDGSTDKFKFYADRNNKTQDAGTTVNYTPFFRLKRGFQSIKYVKKGKKQ